MNYSFNIPFKFNLKTTKKLLLSSMTVYIAGNFYTPSESDSSKETFVKAWSSLLSNNGNLNIQFN